MGSGTLVGIQEYLSTAYRPDCDYVDGVLEERNLGEYDHARLQGLIIAFFFSREAALKVRCVPEQRVRISASRYRIADICLLEASAPKEQIIETPPLLCIEILSPEDTLAKHQARIDDYFSMGVPEVWVIDPKSRRGWRYTDEGSREAKDGVLRTLDGRIELPFAELCMQI
jgi:Uma2 family endonuclease